MKCDMAVRTPTSLTTSSLWTLSCLVSQVDNPHLSYFRFSSDSIYFIEVCAEHIAIYWLYPWQWLSTVLRILLNVQIINNVVLNCHFEACKGKTLTLFHSFLVFQCLRQCYFSAFHIPMTSQQLRCLGLSGLCCFWALYTARLYPHAHQNLLPTPPPRGEGGQDGPLGIGCLSFLCMCPYACSVSLKEMCWLNPCSHAGARPFSLCHHVTWVSRSFPVWGERWMVLL